MDAFLLEGSYSDEMGADSTDEDTSVPAPQPDASVEAAADPSMGLFDVSDDEGSGGRMKSSRLRCGDETSSWHPPLPEPPARHPSTRHMNHCDPNVAWDYDDTASIVRLLDVQGEAPHRCYLVHRKGRTLQLSWVWMEQLDNPSTRDMMKQVDEWKASGDAGPFTG